MTKRSPETSGLVAGKVALVTGGGNGIGRASCLAFAREGARVVVSDRDGPQGESCAAAIREAGGEATFHQTEVSEPAQVEALVQLAVDRYGQLDCALNNAGITGAMGLLHQVDVDAFDETLAINLRGVFLCMKYEIQAMLAQGGGAIVNMASGAGFVATPALSAYCASKHGILGLTKTAAVENARTGVRVNAICPGATDTPMLRASMQGSPEIEKLILRSQPGGRLGNADEIAEAAVWLCSDRASFVSGDSMLVDGAAVAR